MKDVVLFVVKLLAYNSFFDRNWNTVEEIKALETLVVAPL